MTSVRSFPLLALAYFVFAMLPSGCLGDDGHWAEGFHLGGSLRGTATAAVVFEGQLVLGGTLTTGSGTTQYHVVSWTGAGNLRWLSHKLTSYDFFLLDRVISEIRGLNSLPI